MKTLSGDIDYSTEDGYLVLHTQSGDVFISPEDLEELQSVIKEMLEYE
jgi:hypothetical protein